MLRRLNTGSAVAFKTDKTRETLLLRPVSCGYVSVVTVHISKSARFLVYEVFCLATTRIQT